MNRQEYVPVKETLIGGVGGCSASVFDPHEELAWCGNQTGHITSYFSSELQKYTSFQAHSRAHAASETEIKQIITLAAGEGAGGVLGLSGDELCCFTRCGRCVFRYPSPLASANLDSFMSMCLMNNGASLCLGGMNTRLFELDLNTLQCVRQAEPEFRPDLMIEEADIAMLKTVRNTVFVGHASGRIRLVDALTMRTQHAFEAHRGGLTDFDVRGNTLITIGYSPRFVGAAGSTSVFVADRYVQVFDTRVLKAHAPIACTIDPAFCAFTSPFSSSRIIVASQTGLVQLLDASPGLFQVPLESPFGDVQALLSSMDVSSSSQALLFGDSAGRVQLFGVADLDGPPRFNPCSGPTVFADEGPFAIISQTPYADYMQPVNLFDPQSNDFPLSAVAMRYPKQSMSSMISEFASYAAGVSRNNATSRHIGSTRSNNSDKKNAELCSDWPTSLTEYYYSEPRRLPDELFKQCQRSQRGRDMFVCQLKGELGEKFREFLQSTPYRLAKRPKNSKSASGAAKLPSPTASLIATLDYVSVDSYVNYIVQSLYYISPVRSALLSHLCVRESCFWCELATVFQNLDCEPASERARRVVQVDAARTSFSVETSRGAVRSAPLASFLSRMGEVTALNLMPAYQQMLTDLNLVQLVHGWNRFVLQQLTHSRQAQNASSSEEVPEEENEFDQRELTVPRSLKTDEGEKEAEARLADVIQTQCTTALQCKSCNGTAERPTQTVALDVTWSPSGKLQTKTADESSQQQQNTAGEQEIDAGRSSLAFAQLIAASFTNEQHIQAFCTQCAKFHAHVQRRCVSALPEVLSVQCQLSNKDVQAEPFRSASASANITATSTSTGHSKSSKYAIPSRLRLVLADGKVKLADDVESSGDQPEAKSAAESEAEYEYELNTAVFLRWAQLRSLLLEFYASKKQFPIAAFKNSAPALAAFVRVSQAYFEAKRDRLQVAAGKNERPTSTDSASEWFRFVENRVSPVAENEALEFSLPDFPVLLYYVRVRRRDSAASFDQAALDVNLLLKSLRSQPPPTPSLLVPLSLHDLSSLRNLPIGISAEYEIANSDVPDVRYEGSLYYADSEDEATPSVVEDGIDSEMVPADRCFAKPSSYAMHVGGTRLLAGVSSRVRGTLIQPSSLRLSRLSLIRGAGSNYLDAFLDENFDESRSSEVDSRRFKRADQESKKQSTGGSSALRLLRFKLRVLVESRCPFVGFNLRRLFTVLRIAVPPNQLLDLGELFRLPICNALTIRFLVWFYLHTRLPSPQEPGYAQSLIERYNVSATDDENPGEAEKPSEQKESELASVSTKLLLGLLPCFEEAKFSLRLYARYLDLDSSANAQRSEFESEMRLQKLASMWRAANESQFRIPDDDLNCLVRNFPPGLTPQAVACLRVAGH